MLETALKLSDSRLLLFGAIAIDTVGMGTLAVVLAFPQAISSSALLLVAIAITTPVLALTVGVTAPFVPKPLGTEERAHRAILAGTILHMAVQANALLPMLCGCGRGPANLRAYVLHTVTNAAIAAALVVTGALALSGWRKWKRNPARDIAARAPESEL